MKRLIVYIMFFGLLSCVGDDTSFLPQTIKESKENNLLINIYSASDRFIRINNENFEIVEVWSTHKFVKKNSTEVNDKYFVIRVCLKNIHTGKTEPPIEYGRFVKSYCEDCSYGGIGIIDSMLSIIYQDVKLKNKINSFKIGFIDDNGNEKTITFIKMM